MSEDAATARTLATLRFFRDSVARRRIRRNRLPLSHCWIDFRGIQDEFLRGKGIDYFENSRRATLVHLIITFFVYKNMPQLPTDKSATPCILIIIVTILHLENPFCFSHNIAIDN